MCLHIKVLTFKFFQSGLKKKSQQAATKSPFKSTNYTEIGGSWIHIIQSELN
jgi:hypothetical protein